MRLCDEIVRGVSAAVARAAQAAEWPRLAGAWGSLRLRPTSRESAGNRPSPGRSETAALASSQSGLTITTHP